MDRDELTSLEADSVYELESSGLASTWKEPFFSLCWAASTYSIWRLASELSMYVRCWEWDSMSIILAMYKWKWKNFYLVGIVVAHCWVEFFCRQLSMPLTYEVNCKRLKGKERILVIFVQLSELWNNSPDSWLSFLWCSITDITRNSLVESISLLLQEFLFCCSWEREGSLKRGCIWRERWAWDDLMVLPGGLSRRIALVPTGESQEIQVSHKIKMG